VAAAVLALLGADLARASGPGTVTPWSIDRFGGERADLKRLYDGQLGVVMARSPRPQLYIAWRLLHGQQVGQAAGEALSIPCCDPPWRFRYEPRDDVGVDGWLKARKAVPGVAEITFISTDRDGPEYTSTVNCFEEAFDTASATLRDRAAKHGAASPEVRAWIDAQDAVFQACHDPEAKLPEPMAAAPAWLKADRAYQEAAFQLYQGQNFDAAISYSRIAKDRASPWRPLAPYLRARALVRAAQVEKIGEAFAGARVAINDLAKAPAGTFGQGEVRKMRHLLDFRDRPKQLLVDLEKELAAREASPDIAVSFRDYSSLYDKRLGKPAPMDWIATLRAEPARDAVQVANAAELTETETAELDAKAVREALAHARERWSATRDVAWLVAALTLADPDGPAAGELAAAAAKVAPDSPAWLTAQYHLTRLTLAEADPAATRSRLDAILRRTGLSASDRNLFRAQRAQVAADAADFARLSVRQRVCADNDDKNGCARGFWQGDAVQPSGVYDAEGYAGTTGFGEDARAVIDRLPLASRIALGRDAQLPARLRMDVALTSYARAVALGDHAAVDGLTRDLETLLPQLAAEWRAIRAAPVGPEKRFQEFFVLAKVPGLRTDLVDYIRPEGAVAQFQEPWINWVLLPKGQPIAPEAPRLAVYQQLGSGVSESDPDRVTDLACLGECGRGASPLRLPDFAAAGTAQAAAERGYFVRIRPSYGEEPDPLPPGAIVAWEEILTFAKANPKHPQVPEALYWLIRAGRWGGSYNHSGKRAFQLLHAAYPQSTWAKRSPYFYD
jgi:hypothetical protein